jgi:phage gpG-like protein
MYKLKITCNAKADIQMLDRMEKRAKDFRPVFKWAKQEIQKANAANFTSSGLPVGGWSPLSPRYGAWKATHFPGAPIMVRTGALFRSLTNLRGAPNVIGKNFAVFGTDVEYAKFHQYGTTKMAKRQIVFEPTGFEAQLTLRAVEHIENDAVGGMLSWFR